MDPETIAIIELVIKFAGMRPESVIYAICRESGTWVVSTINPFGYFLISPDSRRVVQIP